MNTKRAESIGIYAETDLNQGIKETIDWYNANYKNDLNRYNAFTDKTYN